MFERLYNLGEATFLKGQCPGGLHQRFRFLFALLQLAQEVVAFLLERVPQLFELLILMQQLRPKLCSLQSFR